MSLLPDPAELSAIADRISGHATVVRARAHQLGHAEAACSWSGVAADAFRLEAGDAVVALRGAAARLDDAADTLRRHAANVRHALDLLHVLEHQAAGLVHGAEHGIERGLVSGVGDVAHLVQLVGI